ncbi:MAG: TlpA family protein disulfide reductase [Thermoleophilia bacterium]|nr:TlpA family protein disulfide reductase [Thermoleophilia bacterium]
MLLIVKPSIDRETAFTSKIKICLLVGAIGAALLAAGCGGSEDSPAPPPDYAKKLANSPAPLAALHAQGNDLLEGGQDAFEYRLAKLKGYPVVVNAWASWCGPCRNEFSHFQQTSADLGRKVAFLGIDVEDDAASAETFLKDNPVPYPSYSDPGADIYDSLGLSFGYPGTVFFDAEGKQTFTKPGQYSDQAALEADVQEYALGGENKTS